MATHLLRVINRGDAGTGIQLRLSIGISGITCQVAGSEISLKCNG